MTSKEEYIAFCSQTPEIPLFLQPWWLDAVTKPDGKEWRVLLARNKNGKVEAVMPFLYGSKIGMRYALTPQLTQYTGVWVAEKEGESITQRLSREKALQNDIIRQIGALKLSFFNLSFPLSYTWWPPFYWAGYRQQSQYTYRIEDLSDLEVVYNRFDYAKKKQIRKAAESGIVIDYEMNADELYDLQCTQLRERGTTDVLSRALVRSVVEESRRRNQGVIARARDTNGNTHAAIFIVWDQHSCWELISAIHPAHRSGGASTLVVWEAMKRLSQYTHAWDFEGSMIEDVDNSFRQFGGVPVPYYTIRKATKWFEIMNLCRK